MEKPYKVEIIPYQTRWAGEFREIAAVLRQNLGSLALRIDHIGSTSVPGLAAKDVIDLQISVAAFDAPLRAAMQAAGYTQREGIWRDHRPAYARGPESDWEKWLFDPPLGQRRTHTHVRLLGRPNQRFPLLFRDYLRAHPASAEAYAELKRRLALNLADVRQYPDTKDPAVDLIYFAAEDWAAAVGWLPGPSDA
ncbi:MAG: GrpB family protein [Anaerolineae bacterium]|nr:GrpB family protein [Anaerolineae bacterium]